MLAPSQADVRPYFDPFQYSANERYLEPNQRSKVGQLAKIVND